MKRNIIAQSIGALAGRFGSLVLDKMAEKFATRLLRNAVPWATYAYQSGQRGNTTAVGPTFAPGRLGVTEVKLDFAAIAADRVANSLAALAAADVLQIVGMKAGIWVPATFIQVTTAEGAAATVQLGDGVDPNGFIDAFSLNAVAWGSSLVTTAYSLATAGGKLYTADDTVDLTIDSNNVDVAVAKVIVPMIDVRSVTT